MSMGVVNFDICNYFEKMVGERGKKNILWNYKFCIILTTFHPRSTMAHKGHVCKQKRCAANKEEKHCKKNNRGCNKKRGAAHSPGGTGYTSTEGFPPFFK